MTVTDEHTQAATGTQATEVGRATSTRKDGRRRSRRVIAAVVAFGIMVGAAAGYLAYRASASADPLERGGAADAARLQAQADAYLAGQAAIERGRAADAARLQAQADAYLAGQDEIGGRGSVGVGSDVHLANLSQEIGGRGSVGGRAVSVAEAGPRAQARH